MTISPVTSRQRVRHIAAPRTPGSRSRGSVPRTPSCGSHHVAEVRDHARSVASCSTLVTGATILAMSRARTSVTPCGPQQVLLHDEVGTELSLHLELLVRVKLEDREVRGTPSHRRGPSAGMNSSLEPGRRSARRPSFSSIAWWELRRSVSLGSLIRERSAPAHPQRTSMSLVRVLYEAVEREPGDIDVPGEVAAEDGSATRGGRRKECADVCGTAGPSGHAFGSMSGEAYPSERRSSRTGLCGRQAEIQRPGHRGEPARIVRVDVESTSWPCRGREPCWRARVATSAEGRPASKMPGQLPTCSTIQAAPLDDEAGGHAVDAGPGGTPVAKKEVVVRLAVPSTLASRTNRGSLGRPLWKAAPYTCSEARKRRTCELHSTRCCSQRATAVASVEPPVGLRNHVP